MWLWGILFLQHKTLWIEFLKIHYIYINLFSVSELFVDNPTENDRLDVKVNLTLPRMRCERKYTELVSHVHVLFYSLWMVCLTVTAHDKITSTLYFRHEKWKKCQLCKFVQIMRINECKCFSSFETMRHGQVILNFMKIANDFKYSHSKEYVL